MHFIKWCEHQASPGVDYNYVKEEQTRQHAISRVCNTENRILNLPRC